MEDGRDEGLKALSARVVQGGVGRYAGGQPDAGYGAERAVCPLGGGATLGSGAQGGGHVLRSGCAALHPAPRRAKAWLADHADAVPQCMMAAVM